MLNIIHLKYLEVGGRKSELWACFLFYLLVIYLGFVVKRRKQEGEKVFIDGIPDSEQKGELDIRVFSSPLIPLFSWTNLTPLHFDGVARVHLA